MEAEKFGVRPSLASRRSSFVLEPDYANIAIDCDKWVTAYFFTFLLSPIIPLAFYRQFR